MLLFIALHGYNVGIDVSKPVRSAVGTPTFNGLVLLEEMVSIDGGEAFIDLMLLHQSIRRWNAMDETVADVTVLPVRVMLVHGFAARWQRTHLGDAPRPTIRTFPTSTFPFSMGTGVTFRKITFQCSMGTGGTFCTITLQFSMTT